MINKNIILRIIFEIFLLTRFNNEICWIHSKETTKVRSARNYEVKQFDGMNSFSISVGFLLSFPSFFFFFFFLVIVKSEKRMLDKPEKTVEKKKIDAHLEVLPTKRYRCRRQNIDKFNFIYRYKRYKVERNTRSGNSRENVSR